MNEPLSPAMQKVARTTVDTVRDIVPLYLECQIQLASGQIIDRHKLRLENLDGKEGVSEPFEFNLTLHGNTDPFSDDLGFSRLVGRPVNVYIGLPEWPAYPKYNLHMRADGNGKQVPVSVFNGIVAGFGMQEPGVYQLSMRPTLWRTTLTNHYRMFRQMNVRDVLASICHEHRIEANFDAIGGRDNPAMTRVQDWLQAGESDYEMLRRLMGKAHIYYYFVHQNWRHVLMFANRPAYPAVLGDRQKLRYTWSSADAVGLHQADVIAQYSFQQSLGSSGVQGVFATEEQAANVENRIASFATFRAKSSQNLGELPFNQYRIYQYGGSDKEVMHYTRASNDALRTGFVQLSGASYCPLMRVGHQFSMTAYSWPVRRELEQAPFVLTSVSHKASLDGEYSNEFQATDASGLITPLSVADTQQGALLAKVVAHRTLNQPRSWPYYTPDNFDEQQEMLADSQGVAKQLQAKGVYVQFSTDDDQAPAVWVKLMPSMQHVPEVGTMVLVSRANDESELPEIQSIQADGNLTVTPTDWTAHTQVGNTYSTSYGYGKSIRFSGIWSGSDTDKAVGIVESAYKRRAPDGEHPLFRDASYSRGGGYSYSCSEQMELGMLSESWSYGSGYSNAWAKENKNFSATGRVYHESVTGSSSTALHSTEASEPDAKSAVMASKSLTIGDTWSKSTSNGNTKSITTYNGKVTSTTTHTGTVESTTTYNGLVDSTTTHNGNVESNTTHNGSVTSTSTHNGTVTSTSTHNGNVTSTTTINADTDNTSKITGTSTNHTDHNVVKSYTNISSNSSSDTIGSSSSDSTIGTSTSKTVTNASSVIGITGAHSNISVTGATSNISVTGVSSNIEVLGAGISLSLKVGVVSVDISGPVINIPIIFMIM